MLVEQRQAGRKVLKVKAVVAMEGSNPIPARTMDVAASGMCVALDQPLSVGQAGQIAFSMYFDGQAHMLNVRGRVSYCIFGGGEFKVGFQFTNLPMDAAGTISKYIR